MLRGLTVELGNGTRVFDGLDAELGPGPVALMGPSGSGKTTLLNVLTGLQRHSGTVHLSGVELRPGVPTSRPVACVFQDYRLVEFLNLQENVQLGAEARKVSLPADEAHGLLALVGLGHLRPSRLPSSLSGGEQQRVAIARALAARSDALVADEPTGALDRKTTAAVTATLLDVCAERDVQLVVATHDLAVASQFSTVLTIEAGLLHPHVA